MSEIKAYDLSKYQRIIGNDGSRIQGNWHTLINKRGEVLITPIEVTFWDEGRYSGRIFYPRDLTAWIRADDTVDIPKHMVTESKWAEVEDAWDELVAVIRAVAEEARRVTPAAQEQEPHDD